jgi:hypothetical protein
MGYAQAASTRLGRVRAVKRQASTRLGRVRAVKRLQADRMVGFRF